MVPPPDITKVLTACPGVRHAETAIIRYHDRDLAIAAAQPDGYISGPLLRNHVRDELGDDSLSALGIIAAIETEFGRSLDVYEFMSATSVRQLAEILR